MISPQWAPLLVLVLLLGCGAGTESAAPGQKSDSTLNRLTAEGSAARPRHSEGGDDFERPDDLFSDVTSTTGIEFRFRNGREAGLYSILETVGGGVGMVDFDGDDDLDLFFAGGGQFDLHTGRATGFACRLYRNDGGMRFTDVSEETGVSRMPWDYSHGVTSADYNRDGAPDLFVTCFGRCRLLKNVNGRAYVDSTREAGLDIDGPYTASAWGDVDRDGWPDLLVAGYVRWTPAANDVCIDKQTNVRDCCPPQRYQAVETRLFRNQQDGTFAEVTKKAGLRADGKSLGAVAADFNEDGWIDFYVANDQVVNHLYFGRPQFPLEEAGAVSGTAFNEYGVPEGSMGVDAGDFDGDGRIDIFVTNFDLEDNSLYRNLGSGQFSHATVKSGLGGVGRTLVGFGTGFADFDGDGWLDLFVANGHVYYHRGDDDGRQRALLLRNDGGSRFRDDSASGGTYFRASHAGRGAAVGDLDNDGGLDLVIVHQNDPIVVLKNRRPMKSWTRVRLRGTDSDPDAIGATVESTWQGRTLTRAICSGGGYLSQFDARVLLPAEIETGQSVVVRWLKGRRERFSGLPLGKTTVLEEGRGEPAP